MSTMSKSDWFRNAWLKLVFWGTPIPGIADNAASSPLTQYWLSLHTSDPGSAGGQSTNECTYTPYARVAVVRTSSGWAIAGNSVSPVADVDFPLVTSGSETATFAAIGTAQTGVGEILYRGELQPNIVIAVGVPPVLVRGSTITET